MVEPYAWLKYRHAPASPVRRDGFVFLPCCIFHRGNPPKVGEDFSQNILTGQKPALYTRHMTSTTSSQRGGARFSSTESRIAKIRRVRQIMALGYNSDIACKRAGTSFVNVRKWAKELGIKFDH